MAPANIFFTPFLLVAAVRNRLQRNAKWTPGLEWLALTCSMASGISGMIPELFWGTGGERNLGVWLLWPGLCSLRPHGAHGREKREAQLRLTF